MGPPLKKSFHHALKNGDTYTRPAEVLAVREGTNKTILNQQFAGSLDEAVGPNFWPSDVFEGCTPPSSVFYSGSVHLFARFFVSPRLCSPVFVVRPVVFARLFRSPVFSFRQVVVRPCFVRPFLFHPGWFRRFVCVRPFLSADHACGGYLAKPGGPHMIE